MQSIEGPNCDPNLSSCNMQEIHAVHKSILPGKAEQTCMGTGGWGCARTRLILSGALEFNGGELRVLGLKISKRNSTSADDPYGRKTQTGHVCLKEKKKDDPWQYAWNHRCAAEQ